MLIKDLWVVEVWLVLCIILLWSLRESGSLAYLMVWEWDAPVGNSKERWSYSPHLPSPGHTHTWAHYCTPTTHTHKDTTVMNRISTKSYNKRTCKDLNQWFVYLYLNIQVIKHIFGIKSKMSLRGVQSDPQHDLRKKFFWIMLFKSYLIDSFYLNLD